jgi:VWFA-related protein
MRRYVAALLLALLAIPPLPALQVDQEPPLPVIRATTRAVLVDLIVTDKQGNPITDLKPEEVTLKESGKQQTLSSFRMERIGGEPKALPAGLYSNRPEYQKPPGPVTIVLLDGLNTAITNQQYGRQQILKWLEDQFQPGMRVAVYGLTNKLLQLQSFTTDPAQLLASIRAYKPTSPANSPSTAANIGNANLNVPVGGILGGHVSIGTFMSDTTPQVLEARIATTLAAMRELARITGGMNGRKNLVWISAGFPMSFSPDEGTTITSGMIERAACPTCPPPLPNEAHVQASSNTIQRFQDEIRRTSAAMTNAQMALYPVDARGLVGHDAGDASTKASFSGNVSGLSGDNVAGVSNTQDNMKEMAAQTGGKAYYNRNDIDTAISLASKDGSVYYALSYTSTNKKFNGDYRSIKVEVKRPNVQVRHRAGYFAYDIDKPGKSKKGESKTGALTLADVMADSTLVLFDAQVAPQGGKATAVFRVEPKSVSWGEPGKHDLDLDLYVLAIGADGKVAANQGMTVAQSLDDNQYAQVAQGGLVAPVEITVPKGEYTMKLAVRDNRTGMIGSLTVPFTMP